jgi:hypothetical protein
MPAVATINAGNKSFTVTDTIGGAIVKNTYPMSGTTSLFVQDAGANQTLYLMCAGQMVIAAATSGSFAGNSIFGSTNPSTAQITVEANIGAAGGGGAGAAQIGDLKFGLQIGDHGGWYLCDNRLVASLPIPVQITYNTILGLSLRLPNAPVGTTITVGSRSQSLGSSTITQANLPNVNLTAASASAGTPSGSVVVPTHSATSGGFDPNPTSGVSNLQQTDRTPENNATLGSTIGGGFTGTAMGGHSHTVSLGGSGTAYIPASVGSNMFIYLGT